MTDSAAVIRSLGLSSHPEGGWFKETWRDAHSTAIYYLLAEGEWSQWHRVDRVEVWHFYAGDPLALDVSSDGDTVQRVVLGPDVTAGEQPQQGVPAGTWQSARTLGRWTLVGCTVAPPFEFSAFELAPPGWEPGERRS